MHEHPFDLIAALADGSLSDQTEARALVESCEVCRDEYRAQTEVIAWLAAAPAPAMTELERAALHRDLWTELRSEPSRTSSTPWWQRLSYVAAGLLIAVGLVGVLNNVGFDGGGDAADTTVAADSSGLDAPTEEVPFVAQGSEQDGEFQLESAPETTAAEESLLLPFADLADEARAGAPQRLDAMSIDEDEGECLNRLGLDEHVVVEKVDELDQTYLVVMPEDPDAEPIVSFVTVPGCEIVYVG